MKFAATIIAACIALTGCAATTKFPTESGTVQWHKVTHSQMQEACTDGNIHSKILFTVRACYRMENSVCHIYAEDGKEHLEELGHELKHCFDGYFHDSKGHWLEKEGTEAAE